MDKQIADLKSRYEEVSTHYNDRIKSLEQERDNLLKELKKDANALGPFYTYQVNMGRGDVRNIGTFESHEIALQYLDDVLKETNDDFHVNQLGVVATVNIIQKDKINISEFNKNPNMEVRVILRAFGHHRH